MVQPRAGTREAGQGRDVREGLTCAEDHGGVLAHLHEMGTMLVVLGVWGQAVWGYVAKVTQESEMLPTFALKSPARMTCPDTVAALRCLVSVSNLSETELCCSWTEVAGGT